MKFSIMSAYYQGVTPDWQFQRFMKGINSQTFKDFQLIILHDGPLLRPVPGNVKVYRHKKRFQVMQVRKVGLKMAQGQFFLITNCDNVYYPDTLRKFNRRIESYSGDPEEKMWIGDCKMMGMRQRNGFRFYDNPRNYNQYVILTGTPPMIGNIDLMQACVSKKIWDKYGWFSQIPQSDGVIYQFFGRKYGYEHIGSLIGEHY